MDRSNAHLHFENSIIPLLWPTAPQRKLFGLWWEAYDSDKTIHTSYKTFRFRIRERLSFIRTATRFWTMALVFVLSRTVANDTMSQYNCPIRSTVVAYVIRRYFRSVVVGGNREKILIVRPIQLRYQWNPELENSQCGSYTYCHEHETFLSNRQLSLTFIVILFLPMQPESPILEIVSQDAPLFYEKPYKPAFEIEGRWLSCHE